MNSYTSPSWYPATTAPEPSAPLSAGLFARAILHKNALFLRQVENSKYVVEYST